MNQVQRAFLFDRSFSCFHTWRPTARNDHQFSKGFDCFRCPDFLRGTVFVFYQRPRWRIMTLLKTLKAAGWKSMNGWKIRRTRKSGIFNPKGLLTVKLFFCWSMPYISRYIVTFLASRISEYRISRSTGFDQWKGMSIHECCWVYRVIGNPNSRKIWLDTKLSSSV